MQEAQYPRTGMRRVVFKILVIMVTVLFGLCARKTWKFRVTHFAIFHVYGHSVIVRIISLYFYSIYSEIRTNVLYVKLLSNMYFR